MGKDVVIYGSHIKCALPVEQMCNQIESVLLNYPIIHVKSKSRQITDVRDEIVEGERLFSFCIAVEKIDLQTIIENHQLRTVGEHSSFASVKVGIFPFRKYMIFSLEYFRSSEYLLKLILDFLNKGISSQNELIDGMLDTDLESFYDAVQEFGYISSMRLVFRTISNPVFNAVKSDVNQLQQGLKGDRAAVEISNPTKSAKRAKGLDLGSAVGKEILRETVDEHQADLYLKGKDTDGGPIKQSTENYRRQNTLDSGIIDNPEKRSVAFLEIIRRVFNDH
jgi:hypothetical protein